MAKLVIDESRRRKPLTPAAQRALAEAEARRKAATAADLPPEIGGPSGPEPTRYGDWERKGIAVDF
jgi:hypothetical protein